MYAAPFDTASPKLLRTLTQLVLHETARCERIAGTPTNAAEPVQDCPRPPERHMVAAQVDYPSMHSYLLSMKTTISERGQITIPKAVRQALGLRAGTVVELRTHAGEFIGKKVGADDAFVKWRGKCALPHKLSVDAYLERARGGGAHGR